jgi:hypothetical protein
MPTKVTGATGHIALPLPRRCQMIDEANEAPETRPARGQGNEEIRKGQKARIARPQPKAAPVAPPPPKPQGK